VADLKDWSDIIDMIADGGIERNIPEICVQILKRLHLKELEMATIDEALKTVGATKSLDFEQFAEVKCVYFIRFLPVKCS